MTKNKTQKNEFRYAGVVDYGDGKNLLTAPTDKLPVFEKIADE